MALNDQSDFFIYIPTLKEAEAFVGITTIGCTERTLRHEKNDLPLPDKEWVKVLLTSHLIVYAHPWDKQVLEETPF